MNAPVWRWHVAVQKPDRAWPSNPSPTYSTPVVVPVEGSTCVLRVDYAGCWAPLWHGVVECADRDAAAKLATAWLLEAMR